MYIIYCKHDCVYFPVLTEILLFIKNFLEKKSKKRKEHPPCELQHFVQCETGSSWDFLNWFALKRKRRKVNSDVRPLGPTHQPTSTSWLVGVLNVWARRRKAINWSEIPFPAAKSERAGVTSGTVGVCESVEAITQPSIHTKCSLNRVLHWIQGVFKWSLVRWDISVPLWPYCELFKCHKIIYSCF